MKHPALVFWLLMLLGVSVPYSAYLLRKVSLSSNPDAPPASFSQPEYTIDTSLNGKVVAAFQLTDSSGREFDSQQLEGQVYALNYFFSSCPQVCTQMNFNLAHVQEDPRLAQVKFVSITCDPERDSPAVLAEYTKKFAADPRRWTFLTGEMEDVTHIGKQFGVVVGKEMHSDRVCLVDRTGVIRARLRSTDPEQLELIKRTLVALLKEPVPEKPSPLASDSATKHEASE